MAAFDHQEYQSKIIPIVVLFIIYDILGFCGNIVVLFIYGTRYPKNRFRLLVLALSIVDFTSCCTTVPLETVSTYLYFDPPSRGVCKAKNFFVQLTGLSAMFMLFVTAVYKHRQICRPFKKQLSKKFLVGLCCSGIGSSLICAIPAGILWDINNHNATYNNKTDHFKICEVNAKYHDTVIPQLYRHLLSAYDIFLLATIVLYFFVAKATFMHYAKMKRRMTKNGMLNHSNSFVSRTCNNQMNSDRQAGDNNESRGVNNTDVSVEINTTDVSSDTNRNDDISSTNQVSPPENLDTANNVSRSDSNDPETIARMSQPRSRHRHIDIRKVVMMVIIAGTFSITFLMALTFGYVFAIYGLQDYASVGQYIALFACYRFYFINYCLNPSVYFAFDRRFRAEVLKVLRISDSRSA